MGEGPFGVRPLFEPGLARAADIEGGQVSEKHLKEIQIQARPPH